MLPSLHLLITHEVRRDLDVKAAADTEEEGRLGFRQVQFAGRYVRVPGSLGGC